MININKYYTPTIEEFYVGFEYEALISDFGHQSWSTNDNSSLSDIHEVQKCLTDVSMVYDDIRVKYLDQEDIESLGFNHLFTECNSKGCDHKCFILVQDTYTYSIRKFLKEIIIIKHNSLKVTRKNYFDNCYSNNSEVLFDGRLKNKSELKKLLTQLNIEFNENI